MHCRALRLMQFNIDYDKALLLRLCLLSFHESLTLKAFHSNAIFKKTVMYDLVLVDSLLCLLEGVEDSDSHFTLSLDPHEYDILTKAIQKEISLCKLDILKFKLESLLEHMCS